MAHQAEEVVPLVVDITTGTSAVSTVVVEATPLTATATAGAIVAQDVTALPAEGHSSRHGGEFTSPSSASAGKRGLSLLSAVGSGSAPKRRRMALRWISFSFLVPASCRVF